MCRPIIAAPLRTEVQADGETIHTAFIEVQWASRKFDVERMRDALDVGPRDVVYRREAGTAPSMPPCGRA